MTTQNSFSLKFVLKENKVNKAGFNIKELNVLRLYVGQTSLMQS